MSTAIDLLTLSGGVPSERTGSDTTFSLLLQPYNVRSVTSFLSRAHHAARSKEGRLPTQKAGPGDRGTQRLLPLSSQPMILNSFRNNDQPASQLSLGARKNPRG